jgi:hypothetical protein
MSPKNHLPHPTHPYSSSGKCKSRSLHTQIYCNKPERHTEKDEKERDVREKAAYLSRRKRRGGPRQLS